MFSIFAIHWNTGFQGKKQFKDFCNKTAALDIIYPPVSTGLLTRAGKDGTPSTTFDRFARFTRFFCNFRFFRFFGVFDFERCIRICLPKNKCINATFYLKLRDKSSTSCEKLTGVVHEALGRRKIERGPLRTCRVHRRQLHRGYPSVSCRKA